MLTDDRTTWWRARVDAVIHLRAGKRDLVANYLRQVEQARGRDVALDARDRLWDCARSKSWGDVERWPGWGYRPTPPKAAAPVDQRRSRRR